MMHAAMLKPQFCARRGDALKLHRGSDSGEVSIAPLQPQTPVNPPIARSGTVIAINNLTLGVAALLPRTSGRGGARNRADRESHELTAAQVANLKAADGHAKKIGLPFTRMFTIHWEASGIPLAGMAKATGRFTDLMAKALRRHGSGSAWLWVHEGGERNGGHCHVLAHVPANLVPAVNGLQRGWLRRITGKPYRARVIHSKPIGGRLGLEAGNPDLYAINLESALGYCLKGAGPEAASLFGLDRLEPGGRVIGKRCGTSQNIGAKARKAEQ
jgi:hypothetical protein